MPRYTVRTRSLFAVAALLALAAAACGGGGSDGDNGATGGSSSNGATATETPTQPGLPAAPVPAASVTLEAAGGSAAAGTAALTQAGGAIQYSVTVSGLSEGSHGLYVIQGRTGCEGANRIGPLTPLEASADGSATAEGSLIGQLSDLVGSSLVVYEGETSRTGLVACGQLTANP